MSIIFCDIIVSRVMNYTYAENHWWLNCHWGSTPSRGFWYHHNVIAWLSLLNNGQQWDDLLSASIISPSMRNVNTSSKMPYSAMVSELGQELIRRLDSWTLVPWLSGRTLVFDRRAFAVLCSTYSWRVTTYVGKPSAIGHQTRPTSLSSFQGR